MRLGKYSANYNLTYFQAICYIENVYMNHAWESFKRNILGRKRGYNIQYMESDGKKKNKMNFLSGSGLHLKLDGIFHSIP